MRRNWLSPEPELDEGITLDLGEDIAVEADTEPAVETAAEPEIEFELEGDEQLSNSYRRTRYLHPGD